MEVIQVTVLCSTTILLSVALGFMLSHLTIQWTVNLLTGPQSKDEAADPVDIISKRRDRTA